jgi:hypothetical protein
MGVAVLLPRIRKAQAIAGAASAKGHDAPRPTV